MRSSILMINTSYRHCDLSWNEFAQVDLCSGFPKRTGPRPDVTYAFPIIDMSTVAPAHRLDSQVRGFSKEVISRLYSRNISLKFAPTTGLRQYTKKNITKLRTSHLNCFPWAVVEVKPDEVVKSVESFCYCQAANASAEAHAMREKLMEYIGEDTEEHDALVIFSFTCIGPDIKFWLTYREPVSANPRKMSLVQIAHAEL
jgi:hypothetical protein